MPKLEDRTNRLTQIFVVLAASAALLIAPSAGAQDAIAGSGKKAAKKQPAKAAAKPLGGDNCYRFMALAMPSRLRPRQFCGAARHFP